MNLRDPLPWSSKKLRRLGECIRDDVALPPGTPTYGEVMLHYNDVAVEVEHQINALDWEALLGGPKPEVTSRPKTIDTLRQKLQRHRTTPLSNIQDVAGVRFEAEMSLSEQDAVVTAIAGLFGADLDSCVHDLRSNPHSGYRAVHIWLRLPTKVEVQVRTHLQGNWANMYERAADFIGREIRYDELPSDPEQRTAVEQLQEVGTKHIADLENFRDQLKLSETKLEDALRGRARSDRRAMKKVRGQIDAGWQQLRDIEAQAAEQMNIITTLFDTLRAQQERGGSWQHS